MTLGRKLLLFLVPVSLSLVSVQAQITSTIHGVVRDSQGGVLPGVTVTVNSESLKRGPVSVVTGDAGQYRIPGLQPGVYSLKAVLQGFATETVSKISLSLNSDIEVNVKMTVASIQQEVTVNANVAMVRQKGSDLQELINNKTIDDIPLNGRQFLDLIKLVPGVSSRPPQSQQGANVTVFGERSVTNSFLVDGFDNNDPTTRDFAEFFIQDAIQEFKVMLGGYQAEFGRASGAVTNVVTQSGTNSFHGRVFGYFRDSAMDSSNIAGQDPPELKRQEVGANLGGPIWKDKTFFFDAFQFFREKRGINFDQSILPPIIRSGFFTPAYDGVEPFDQSPLDTRYTNFLRLDHQFNATNQLFVTFNLNRGNNDFFIPGTKRGFASPPPGTIALPSVASDLENNTTSVNGRYTTFFNNSTFLESSLRWGRLEFGENLNKPNEAELFFPITFSPTVQIWESNTSPVADRKRTQDLFQWSEGLSFSQSMGDWGTHSFKFGVDLDRVKLDNLLLASSQLIIGNTALDSRFNELGYTVGVQRGTNPVVSGDPHARATNNGWALYAEDTWNLGAGVTLDLGLRYDYSTLFSDDKNNLAPRVGFAWDIGMSGKTVLRAGFGRYYDPSLMAAVLKNPQLGGVQYGEFSFWVIPRGGAFFNNPSIGAFGPLQAGGTRWLANPKFFSYIFPEGAMRSSGNLSITGKGQPYILYDLLGIPVNDPATPPLLTYDTISTLTGGAMTPEQALEVLNNFFPGPECPQFDFLEETGPASVNSGRPLIMKFRQCGPIADRINTIQRPMRLPHTDSFNIGIEQAIGKDFSVEGQVFIRRSRDLWATRVANLREVPIAASCSGNTTDGGPCNSQTEPIGFLDTNAFVFSLRKRFSQNYSFLLSYTYTDATDNFSTLEVPPVPGEISFLFSNHPELDIGRSLNTPQHVLVFNGAYQMPWGFNLSGVLNASSGRPFNAAGLPEDSDGDTNFDNRLVGTEKGAYVTDRFFNLDLRLGKEFSLGERLMAHAFFEVFNVTNRANPLEVDNNCQDSNGDGLPDAGGCNAPTFGRTIVPLPGREIQLGFRLDF